jgi:hypothetical protein
MNNKSKAEQFLEHPIANKRSGNTGIINLSFVLEQLCFLNCSILLIGTGFTCEQVLDWPSILQDIWRNQR